ncbi:hypothetical protein Tco_0867514, partial [Tanacetum coccineum]
RAKYDLFLNNICEVFNGKIVEGRDKSMITLLEYIREYSMKRIVNVLGVIDKCTGPLTPTTTRIMKSIKKEAHLMKEIGIDRDSLNTRHNKATCKGQGQKATTGGNNAEASGSASRQAQQTEPAVGQDGLGGSVAGAVIGLSGAAGEGGAGGPGGAGVTSQVSETRNVDGREMGDGVPTQSSAAGGVMSDNGNFPMVDKEEVNSKKLASMAEEMIMLIEVSDFIWYNDEIMEQVEKLADGWRTTVSYFVDKAVKKYADDE